MPCACLSRLGATEANQSTLDAGFLADLTRTVSTGGDYVVVPFTTLGDFTPVRAVVVAQDATRALVSAPG